MLDDKLQIKVANYEAGEIWHPKMYLLEDTEGNKLSATGSGNMTGDGFENNYENSYRLKSVMNPDNCKFRRLVIRIQFENSYGLKTVTRIENSYLSVIESG